MDKSFNEPVTNDLSEMIIYKNEHHPELKFVNKTPHQLSLFDDGEPVIELEKADHPARVETVRRNLTQLDLYGVGSVSFPIEDYTKTVNLPDPENQVFYIVSSVVALYAQDRADLVVPRDFVKTDEGKIIGCETLTHPRFEQHNGDQDE